MTGELAERRAELLDELAVPGVDIDRAAARIAAARAGRQRRRRARLSGVAAVVLLLGASVGVLVTASGGGDELVADADEPVELTTTSTTTTAAARDEQPTTVVEPGDLVAEPDVEPPPTSVAPADTLPTTTAAPPFAPTPVAPAPTMPQPPSDPLFARVVASTDSVVAGEHLSVELAWLDGDHVGGPPQIRIDWGDPLLQPTLIGPETLDCRGHARPSGAVEAADVRFASPGRRTVRAEVAACDGPDGTAHRTVTEAVVDVAAPTLDGQPARTVVAHLPPGSIAPGALDSAIASFMPDDGGARTALGQRRPTLGQKAADGPATVLVVPAGQPGRLELLWPARQCAAAADVTGSPAGSALLVPLVLTC